MSSARLKLGAQVLALGVVLGLLALLVWKIVNQNPSHIPSDLRAGKHPVAPNFTLTRLDKPGKLSLASLSGKVVVLNFWASWCAPCRDEVPVLEKAWQRFRHDGVVVLGVDYNDLSSDARSFASKYGMTYPTVHDGPGHVLALYGGTGVPETFVISRHKGRVIARIAGQIHEENQLVEAIHAAMRS